VRKDNARRRAGSDCLDGRVYRGHRDAAAAVATGPCVLPDKGRRSDDEARARARIRYRYLNDGHIPDHAMPRQGPNGSHIVDEVKVYTPHHPHSAGTGRGDRRHGGQPVNVGHSYSFGNTEERLRREVFGTEQQGEQGDAPFDHSTGEGLIMATVGYYADSVSQGNETNLLIHETYGGINDTGAAFLGRLQALAARRDDTEYHDPPGNKRLSYYEHWMRLLSGAAALGDAARILHYIHGQSRGATRAI